MRVRLLLLLALARASEPAPAISAVVSNSAQASEWLQSTTVAVSKGVHSIHNPRIFTGTARHM